MEGSTSKHWRILVIDDHAIVRAGIKHVVDDEMDMTVMGEAGSLKAGLALLRDQPFDVVLFDLNLGDGTGWDLLKAVAAMPNRPRLLMITTLGEEHIGVQALRAGADGFMNKEAPTTELVTAIRRIAGGGKYISAGLAEQLARNVTQPHRRTVALSQREHHILCAIASGHSLTAIAAELHVSPKTVTTYRRRLLEKLGLNNNAELTRYALDNGLLPR